MSTDDTGLQLQTEEYETDLGDILDALVEFQERLDPKRLGDGEGEWLRRLAVLAAEISSEIGCVDLGEGVAKRLDSVKKIIDDIASGNPESRRIIEESYYKKAEPSLEMNSPDVLVCE